MLLCQRGTWINWEYNKLGLRRKHIKKNTRFTGAQPAGERSKNEVLLWVRKMLADLTVIVMAYIWGSQPEINNFEAFALVIPIWRFNFTFFLTWNYSNMPWSSNLSCLSLSWHGHFSFMSILMILSSTHCLWVGFRVVSLEYRRVLGDL